MTKKSKMDRGLDSLFFDNSIDEITRSDSESVKNDDGKNGISTVRISLIEPDKNQPRSEFDEDALNELAENIRQHGVLQPILVRPLDNGGYKIVAGERRWRAARLAGLDEIPVYIKELTDLEAAEISLIENIQRKDLTPLEEAAAYETLMETYGLTQQQVAEAVGRSRSAVANSVRLLSLSENVQEMLRDKKLTEGHAKVLAGVADKDTQEKLAAECIEKSWTVRELEKAGYMVYASDLIDRGCGEKLDFLASVAPPHSGHGHRYEPTVFPCVRVCGTRARHLRRWLQGRDVSQNTVSGGQVPAGAV